MHPEDERYKHLIGKNALVPMLNRRIPVIADEYVDREFGTGALKITPAHDFNDYEIGQRHNLQLINIMNRDATMNEKPGHMPGWIASNVAKNCGRIWKRSGMTIKVEDITSRRAAFTARRRSGRADDQYPVVPED